MSKPLALSLVILLLSVVALSACESSAEQGERLVNEGEEIYIANCARCHEVNGLGFQDVYPPLSGNPIVTLHDPAPTIRTVLHGRGAMPGFRETLEHDELAAVVSYIRNAWDNNASVVFPEQIR